MNIGQIILLCILSASVLMVFLYFLWKTRLILVELGALIGIERWNRDLMRRVLFAGVRGGPDGVPELVRAYRMYNLAGIGGFALCAVLIVGPGFIFIAIPIMAVWFLSKPINIKDIHP